ncbi:MAG: RelA/SpoT domain-containing protein [Magnetococcales bacterium]|nr:RelA/SpoT domain-containing protein [Magnetococcales bacterium]
MSNPLGNLQREIISEYDRELSVYKDFVEVNLKLFDAFIKENKISVYSINSHIIDRETLIKKLSGQYKIISTIDDINDLLSIRVLTFFEDDVDNISEIIDSEFNIVTDFLMKPETRDPKRFGYYSRQYITRMLDSRLEWIEYRRFKNLKLNIEVKSLLQHAWYEIQHLLFGEEGKTSHPELYRACSRVVGALEIVDRELKRVKLINNRINKSTPSAPDGTTPPINQAPDHKPHHPVREIEEIKLVPQSQEDPVIEPHVATEPMDSEEASNFEKISELVLNDGDVRIFDRKIADIYDTHLEYKEHFVIELSKIAARFSHFSYGDVKNILKKHMKEIDYIKEEFLHELPGNRNYMVRGMSLLYMFYKISSLSEDKETVRKIIKISNSYGG